MARLRAVTSITHGQRKENERLVFNITKGQTFDPVEIGMDQAQADRLLTRKAAEKYDGGEMTKVTPVKTPSVPSSAGKAATK